MKKNLYLFAAAVALGLASCSSDETIESAATSPSNEISFRSSVAGQTRAADITTANLTSFKAYAKLSSDGTTTYFAEDVFTKSESTFSSDNKHYWPASGSLDFYAYAPTTSTQFTHASTETLGFTVTPSSTVSEQVDLVVANTNEKSKDGIYSSTKHYGADGIPLNFRHAESKVVVIFKNTKGNLKIDVQAFKIVNVDGTATYTYTKASNTSTDGNNTDPAASGTTLANQWTDNTTYNTTYTATPDATNQIAASTTTAVYLQNNGTASTTPNEALSMILIPQTTTAVGAYTGTTANDPLEASKTYIAVKMTIKNNDAAGTVIANCTGDGDWAIWPVAFTWVPGKKYIYTVDLGDGGYWEKEHVAGDTDLDKVLEGAEIKFVSVTVDDWDNSASDVAFP